MMGSQLVYTVLCFVPALCCYYSHVFHVAFLLVVIYCVIADGGHYYIMRFPAEQQKKFDRIEKSRFHAGM
jgi:hypothetical protein